MKADFSASHALAQSYIDGQLLPGFSSVVLHHGDVVDSFCAGHANIETGEPLRPEHIHRIFSNTKLMTSVVTLMLMEEGHFGLDDPIKQWISEFGQVRVLKAGATSTDDTETLQVDISIRHLLSHQSGLSHGVFDPGSVIFNAYTAAGVRSPNLSLTEVMPRLAALPLSFQPGTDWDYAMGADLLARLAEIVTGQPWQDVLRTRLLAPLGMRDTGYLVRDGEQARLATLYRGTDLWKPRLPGLFAHPDVPWPNANLQPVARQAGTGGLVSTQADYLRFLMQLQPGQPGLLKPATLTEMMRDQLPAHVCVRFQAMGRLDHLGFGLGGAVTRRASALQPNSLAGEFQWGGLAGTHWCISPANGVTIVQMAQRHFGFWNPFWFEYKAKVYETMLLLK
jgi:CubicO group peptidase (beta-lactamase class C family)